MAKIPDKIETWQMLELGKLARASYAIYYSETSQIKLYRVPYDIAATQAKMVEQRLPMRLVARLSHGE